MSAREIASYGVLCFVSIFAVVNPLRATAVFATLSEGWDATERRRVVRRAIAVAAALLFGVAWVGKHIIVHAGIQVGGFRVASGLLLLGWALRQMLHDGPLGSELADSQTAEKSPLALAVSPVAIPLLAGVAPVATVVLYTGESQELWRSVVTMIALGLTLVIAYGMLRKAAQIRRALGELGARWLSRLLALTVAAWGVDFIAVGVRDLLPLILTTPPAR